jgi:hypothetical protein
VGGEMHDRVDLVILEYLRDERIIAHIPDDQFPGGYRLAKSLDQIVENDDTLARLTQLANDVTADVAGAAGD